ncbi:replication initiation protein [Listeria valentina]|uniref:replication initiation protein n=1 Tax=Listeria valentina TaxID=2705293 RepID=UPI0014311F04|nr:replication initiation protein [Listeria valentina]
MANETVIYKNELNFVPMRKFDSAEMDIFFAICSKMKDKNLESVTFSFEQLRELSNYSSRSISRFTNDLENIYKKMLQLTYWEQEENKKSYFVLFTGFTIDFAEQKIEISTNPKLSHILNQLESEFTKYELAEFTEIRSSYAKSMYRLLKQYRLTGYYKTSVETFRALLDVPKSYQMTKITEKVLKPILKELTIYFQNLKITKIKERGKNKIAFLEFTFLPEKRYDVPNWKSPSTQSKETLPEWAKETYIPEKPTLQPFEEWQSIQQKLAEYGHELHETYNDVVQKYMQDMQEWEERYGQ